MLLSFIVLTALIIPAGVTMASRLSGVPSNGGHTPYTADALLRLIPSQVPGSCAAPPNGGTVNVGCRFVLDLWVDTGSNPDATAQQSYLTYTYNLIQNARVSTISSTCTLTSTVTPVLDTFDATLQNEVCNGPNPCVFRGSTIDAGSLAFASGALSNCPEGCGGVFQVAQIALCAIAPGQAVLHWQFTPPAPLTRDTEIVSFGGDIITNSQLFTDYIINIVGATPTPTNTNTAVPTSTNTNTPIPPSNTPTNTNTAIPTNTNTAVPTNTNTAVPTNTNTAVPTNTDTSTPLPPTSTPTDTNTAVPTSTSTSTPIPATDTPTNTNTSTPLPSTSTPTDTNTAVPTSTNTSTPIPATDTPTNTNTAVATSTNTVVPSTSTSVPATSTSIPATSTSTSVPSTPTNTNTVIPASSTPTRTNTSLPASSTPTRTNTQVLSTSTSTRTPAQVSSTPTRTSTPNVTTTPCTECHVKFKKPSDAQDAVTLACNPDGTLHWTATLVNKPDYDEDPGCTLAIPYRATLQVKCNNNTPCKAAYGEGWRVVQVQRGTAVLPARRTVTLQGDFCFTMPAGVDKVHYEFSLDSARHECNKKKKSHDISPCDVNPTCPPSGPEFPDVVGSPFASDIQQLSNIGVISGYNDGSFKPNAPINRGQVAKMVVIANGLRAVDSEQHFSDVPASNPYFSYVEAAYAQGVISGYSDGTFRPYDNVTRGQIAKIVVQAAGLNLVTPTTPSFTDVPTTSVFYSYIETAFANGLLNGYSDGAFRPGTNATRGQVSKLVSNLMSSAD